MACKLGRATLPSPDTLSQPSGKLVVGHTGYPFTGSEGLVMAQQVSGYPNPDEEEIRFTYDATAADGVLDGYYLVESTKVDWVKLAAGLFAWEAQLIPLTDMASPQMSIGIYGTDRTASAPPTETPYVGSGASTRDDLIGATLTAAINVVSEFGNGSLAQISDYTATLLVTQSPANAYNAAATIEATLDAGTNWWQVTGRAIPNDATGWRIGNGKWRLSALATGFRMEQRADIGGAWTAIDINFGERSGGAFTNAVTSTGATVTVLVNSPEVVSVRYSLSGQLGYIDFTMRRASPIIEVYRYNPTTSVLAIWRQVSHAASAVTGGIEATSANGDGNKYSIFSADAFSTQLTTTAGVYLATTDTEMRAGLAIPATGWSGGFPDPNQLYYANVEHVQEVVGR